MTTKQLNIENRTYYFCNDLINVTHFEASNLKLETWKDLDIYCIGYVDRKPEWHVNSVNPLYLMINRFYGCFKSDSEQKNSDKYLCIDDNTETLKKYSQVFDGIKHHLKN